MKNTKSLLFEFSIYNDKNTFSSSISEALIEANDELSDLENQYKESIETIKELKPDCDKYDYILSACSGALCGIIDLFLVGKPGDSPLGNITDKKFKDLTISFAKKCGYKDDGKPASSAIKYLEKKFKVPYDQSVGKGIFKELINLTPSNHHFKSMGHNPSLLGLYFSIVNQFENTSTFISNGELITLTNSDSVFELKGKNTVSKLYCGIVNWIGHLISDGSGSSSSKGRGMGIPSPLYTWSNDVITIKRKLNIPVSEFNKAFNELALSLFQKGYDVRFQTTQTIPVFINEMIVRVLYSIRRLIKYYMTVPKEERCHALFKKFCKPFSNATVERMLTVAHGVFCITDISDAVIHGVTKEPGTFDIVECFLRLNVVGIQRFSFALYGEVKRSARSKRIKSNAIFIHKEQSIVANYIEGLKILSTIYNDASLLSFINDLQKKELYEKAFDTSVQLATLRNVSEEKILKSKEDIDIFFKGSN